LIVISNKLTQLKWEARELIAGKKREEDKALRDIDVSI